MKGRSRLLKRRACAALCWAGAWFVLAQLLGGLALDYVWPQVRFPSAGVILTTLARSRHQPDIVCLGSSRFVAGIREPEIAATLRAQVPGARAPHVFNAAVPAGDLISADFLLKELLARGARPALAIIEVNPETLNHYNEWFFFHVRRQVRWEDVPACFADVCRAHQLRRLVAARLLPLSVHRRQLQHALFGALGPESGPWAAEAQPRAGVCDVAALAPTAARSSSVVWDDIARKLREPPDPGQVEGTQAGVGQAYRWLKKYRVGGASVAALDRLLGRCQEHGIRPVLVAVPVAQAHREAYTPAIEAQFQQYRQHVTQLHGCPFGDFRGRVPDGLFLDNHHLVPEEGGLYFSRLLAKELLAPVWANCP